MACKTLPFSRFTLLESGERIFPPLSSGSAPGMHQGEPPPSCYGIRSRILSHGSDRTGQSHTKAPAPRARHRPPKRAVTPVEKAA